MSKEVRESPAVILAWLQPALPGGSASFLALHPSHTAQVAGQQVQDIVEAYVENLEGLGGESAEGIVGEAPTCVFPGGGILPPIVACINHLCLLFHGCETEEAGKEQELACGRSSINVVLGAR